MPGLAHFLECVGRAVAKHGGRALARIVSFGDVVYDVVSDAHLDYSRDCKEAELRAAIQELATADPREVRGAVEQVVASHPVEMRETLSLYLEQIPPSIRQSMRRPEDPSGRTVPELLPLPAV